MKFRIYIDEVGNPDLECSDDANHRFLSLTGIVLELGYIESVVHPQMEDLKRKFFRHHPDDPVIFHRKELLSGAAPFNILKDQDVRRRFDHELLDLLNAWDYKAISVCLDKKKHKEQYTTWRYDPYHYCLAVLLERYIFFLQQHSSSGDVLAESRGGKEDIRLKKAFHRLWEKGTDYVAPETFQQFLTSRELKVKPKANNIAGLQIADLIAHPSRNEILGTRHRFQKIGTCPRFSCPRISWGHDPNSREFGHVPNFGPPNFSSRILLPKNPASTSPPSTAR